MTAERWWGGYAIRIEKRPEGWCYALRRDLFPGDAVREHWGARVGFFPTEEMAHEAAVFGIIARESRRTASEADDLR